MRLLFEIDRKDYDPNGDKFIRPSARGIIFRDGKLSVIYSRARNYCKFPGGGIEKGEDPVKALIREVKEETGLTVIPSSVKEFGYVHRIQKGEREAMFVQDNYYYFCDVEELQENVEFTADEIREDFVPMFMPIEEAIKINREFPHTNEMYDAMIERERRVMELIVEENKTRI